VPEAFATQQVAGAIADAALSDAVEGRLHAGSERDPCFVERHAA
jgi:hypothetical protein